jgi:hypothetical protein
MSPLDSHYATRRRLKVGLTLAGILAGAAFGVVLTRLGKIVSGAPPGTFANYLWNAAVFGAVAGIVSPLVAWSGLRRVPLWRTVAEPLLWAVGGGVAAVLVASGALLLVLPPIGLTLGFLNLRRRYPDPTGWLPPRDDDPILRKANPPAPSAREPLRGTDAAAS